jgi:hypothetical protein
MTAMHQVRFVQADCQHCRRSFPIPLLDDFSYGSFVLHGENGGVFGFLTSLECPPWEDIESRLQTITGQRKFTSPADISRFQAVIASCADDIEGQPLHLTPVCPFCRSHSLEYGDSRPLDSRRIPAVTFTEFQSLSDSSKMQRLAEFWNSPFSPA